MKHQAKGRMSPEDRLLRLNEVITMLGICRATLYNWLQNDRFPQPTYLGKMPCWRLSVVQRVMNEGVRLEA